MTIFTRSNAFNSLECRGPVTVWMAGMRLPGDYSLLRVWSRDNSMRNYGLLTSLSTIARALSKALIWATFIRTGILLDEDFDKLLA